MARVTVEDCLDRVDSHFDLVSIATVRARQLINGQSSSVDMVEDRCPVVALREIAAGNVDATVLEGSDFEEMMHEYRRSTREQDHDGGVFIPGEY